VTANAAAPGAIYIKSATLNGKPLDRAWLTHDEIAAGGALAVELVPEPDRNWGTKTLPPSLVPASP
jgi:putative alpha-1,2-mannosidase